MPRSLVALFAASAAMVPTFTLYLVVASILVPLTDFSVPTAVLAGVLYGVFAALVAAVVMVLYAMPVYLFLTWRGWDNLYTCLLFALAPSVLVIIGSDESNRTALIGFTALAFHSLVAALTFWWVAKPP